jgi:hypothetical protein
MKTKKQEELTAAFLAELDDAAGPLYKDIIMCLSELGYAPQKARSNMAFKHDLHNKQIAKMGVKMGAKTGMRTNKKIGSAPFFALRFSACRGYSQRFAGIVKANIEKSPSKTPRCTVNACNFCAGEPVTHVYTCEFPNGENKTHCGAYALEIPDVTETDIDEIKKLIKEEHEYLMKHEAGVLTT